MPTNAGPEYKKAEARFRLATGASEQLALLQEMLALLPKHKGTEKLQADLKRRISELRKETATRQRGGHKPFHVVDHVEGGQTVLVGPPNSGKSLLLRRLTNAEPEVAPYPFTTQAPVPGMMMFEDTMVQLVDLPPLARDGSEPWLFDAIRRAHVLLVVVDASDDDVPASLNEVLEAFEEKGISVAPPGDDGDEEVLLPKRAIIVANKVDSDRARDNVAILADLYQGRLPMLDVSAETGYHLEELRRAVYEALDIVRVYTKAPGRSLERTRPFLLPAGSTVLDAARAVHADFAEKMRYARIWGVGRFEGQMVARDDALHDGDLLEFHL
jgi:hypothetical protein